jgi:hypothetical protein
MVIQLIPRQREGSAVFVNILFYFSLILLIASIASYFILDNLQQKTVKTIESLDAELAIADASPEAATKKIIQDYEKKINDFSFLLAAHKYNSQVFPLIESLTHPKVVFSNFSQDSDKRTIVLSGVTDSFQTLGQQLFIFKNGEFIEEVKLSNIAFKEDGRISFGFDLVLDPKIFIKQENE